MALRQTFATLSLVAALAAASGGAWVAQPPSPDFGPTPNVGWMAEGDVFLAPAKGAGPVLSDPSHPRVSNAESVATGKPPQFHIGDPNSPILQPWAKEAVGKRSAAILAGKPGYTRAVSCWPLGVPAFLLGPVQPFFFVHTPKEVLLTWQEDHEPRHIYMNVPHSKAPKASWYGESVGHYEGDTLVVDTMGLNDKVFVDHFRTPHSTKLHVVERFRMIDGGKRLEIAIHVEDPGAFTTAWDAVQHFRRVDGAPMIESVCEENNTNYFNQDVEPMPTAARADF